ncbi:MAG: sulfur carrier protein ThiS [Chloroflexi bacterium]|nr:sulfur carrier protein ThiS [Chloroflexota bacterium]MYA01767.1 sulfur carrier protein ThiS [Chloroflexota bacterium]MYJ93314.1 sulfur carrier protein ThiS [Chloroflexota bacterium]
MDRHGTLPAWNTAGSGHGPLAGGSHGDRRNAGAARSLQHRATGTTADQHGGGIVSEAQSALSVTLNGEAVSISHRQLTEALCEFGYDPEQQGIAVAINMSVVPRSEWTQTSIADGDRIDIVGAKQGG